MKKFWKKNKSDIFFVVVLFALWRIVLSLAQFLSSYIPLQPFGKGPLWQNFDGYHYQFIAHHGYGQYEQAFFPLFPLTLSFIEKLMPIGGMLPGILLVSLFFLMGLFVFYKLLRLDLTEENARWSIAFFLFFFTSFFFGSIYTEALFILLVFSCFYLARKHYFFWAAVVAGFASATRLVGVFLLFAILVEYIFYLRGKNKKIDWVSTYAHIVGLTIVALSGLLGYMLFLWKTYNDPLLFVHALSGFQTGRTTTTIVLLPQVFFRYIKIFFSVPIFTHDFLIAFLEFFTTIIFLGILLAFWKRVRFSYLIFGLCALLLPTISGTLTSMPRYILVVFPVFMLLGTIHSRMLKVLVLSAFSIVLLILCTFFLRGYFIA